jgi:hypothetical protein
MTVSHWMRPHNFKTPDTTTDVLIIGGGYVGLSTAFWLSEYNPSLKITVLERSQIGAGASGRNAGFLTMGSATFYKTLVKEWGKERALEIYRFGRGSISLVEQKILRSSPEIKFERSSSLTLLQNQAQFEKWQDVDFDPTEFDFQFNTEDKLPSALKDKFFGAYENGPEFKINPIQLLATLRRILETRKIQIIENSSAFELTPDGVMTDLNFIKCQQLILALNGYFPHFHPIFKGIIKPYRAQMLAVELEEDFEANSLHYDSPERVYWRKSWDKILLIGGKRVLDEVGEVGDFEKVSPIIQAGLEDYLHQQLKIRFKVIHRWSGTMGFTEHELPILTKASKSPLETFIIGGFSGHGMGFGFRSAKEMAELVCGQKQKSFFDQFKDFRIEL